MLHERLPGRLLNYRFGCACVGGVFQYWIGSSKGHQWRLGYRICPSAFIGLPHESPSLWLVYHQTLCTWVRWVHSSTSTEDPGMAPYGSEECRLNSSSYFILASRAQFLSLPLWSASRKPGHRTHSLHSACKCENVSQVFFFNCGEGNSLRPAVFEPHRSVRISCSVMFPERSTHTHTHTHSQLFT